MLDAYWWKRRFNFGDAINPWLLELLSGEQIRWSAAEGEPVLLATGSVIHQAKRGWRVWGSGCISATSAIPDGLELLALRGPRTARRLLQHGYPEVSVWGDPALLLPLIFKPIAAPRFEWGIVPHYTEVWRSRMLGLTDRVRYLLGRARKFPPDIQLIPPTLALDEFLVRILSCRKIASTSLHGLIAADAYGIPNVWLTRRRSKIIGGRFKFDDYQESVGRSAGEPIFWDGDLPRAKMEERILAWNPIAWDPIPLLEAFPCKRKEWTDVLMKAKAQSVGP
jgi:pyruvyltransferase